MTDDELLLRMAEAISLCADSEVAARAALKIAKREMIERAARIIEGTKAAPENCDVLEEIAARIRRLADE